MQPEAAGTGFVDRFRVPGELLDHPVDGVLLDTQGAEIGDGGLGPGPTQAAEMVSLRTSNPT